MKVPEGFILCTIAKRSRMIISEDKIVAVVELPEGGSDVYTCEPAESNAHFRVDEDLETIAHRIQHAHPLADLLAEEFHNKPGKPS